MSVLVSDRTESKFEAITYSIELHDMLIDFMQRSFGVKDLDQLVRVRYAHGKDATEDFSRYRSKAGYYDAKKAQETRWQSEEWGDFV